MRFAAVIAATCSVVGFAFSPSSPTRRQSTTRLHLSDREKILRQEVVNRNAEVDNEGKYAVADGEDFDKLNEAQISVISDEEVEKLQISPVKEDKNDLAARMERMTEPRPFALFIAEKAAEFVEASLSDVCKGFKRSIPSNNGVGVKEKVVILGSGWGAVSYVKDIDTDLYDVTVISPRNHFVFTPMLAGASVGTVEFRSITQPIREVNRKARFLEAFAKEIDPETNTIVCESVVCDGNSCDLEEFTVDYDRLIVTVGAQTNTFGIPGVREHCCYLRQIEDARRIRTAIVNCFERANLPNLTDEERVQNLTFAVIGAGPTGIEFAAELRDFIEQDGPKYYPDLLKFVRIKVIEASSTVLAPFDKSLQEEAIKQMNRAPLMSEDDGLNLLPDRFKLVELLLDSSVKEVTEKTIELNDGTVLQYGLALWAAGNGPVPITLQLIDSLGEEQAKEQAVARGRLGIDPWMRVIGGDGKILAFGDCTCISSASLPATAQVASQQGEYLANVMNRKFDLSPPMSEEGIFPPPLRDPTRTETSVSDYIAGFAINSSEYAKPFQFLNLGILAYTGGGSALAQVSALPDSPPVKGTGKIGNLVWRSVYLSKQVSWRNRLLVLNDWTTRQMFGRDITRL
jgi:NADH dehydrogenase FAD-containing subunit